MRLLGSLGGRARITARVTNELGLPGTEGFPWTGPRISFLRLKSSQASWNTWSP